MATATEPRRTTAGRSRPRCSSAASGSTAPAARRSTPSTRPPRRSSPGGRRATRPTSTWPSRPPARRSRTAPGRKMDARDRGRLINKLADLIEEEHRRAGRARNARQRQADPRRARRRPAADDRLLRYYAGWADKIHGQTIPVRGNYFCYTRHEPVGVVGQIIPWNFPMLMVAWKWGPALAAGCTIVHEAGRADAADLPAHGASWPRRPAFPTA